MTKFKIARGYFSNRYKQNDIARSIGCHKNTVNNIIRKCLSYDPEDKICNFPSLIIDDFFTPFQAFFNTEKNETSLITKSQNVLTPYRGRGLC